MRLIDLDKIKPMDFPSYEMDGLDVVQYLSSLPTVEAAPVVHGRWIPCENGGYYCSNCDTRVAFLVHNKYCPNCGAKMDK